VLTEIHSKLNEAARIAKTAEACALAGSVAEGVIVSMDIEQLIYEAGRLQDAASPLNRLSVNRRSNLTPYRRPTLTPLGDGFWR
jgi:hypothetical protein